MTFNGLATGEKFDKYEWAVNAANVTGSKLMVRSDGRIVAVKNDSQPEQKRQRRYEARANARPVHVDRYQSEDEQEQRVRY